MNRFHEKRIDNSTDAKPDQSKELERPMNITRQLKQLNDYVDQCENKIQSLKDELERKNTILTNARAEEGRLNADIKFKQSQIKELENKNKALEFLNKTAPTTMLEDEIKELRKYPISHKDECGKWEGHTLVGNRKCTCGLEQLLNKIRDAETH